MFLSFPFLFDFFLIFIFVAVSFGFSFFLSAFLFFCVVMFSWLQSFVCYCHMFCGLFWLHYVWSVVCDLPFLWRWWWRFTIFILSLIMNECTWSALIKDLCAIYQHPINVQHICTLSQSSWYIPLQQKYGYAMIVTRMWDQCT